MISQAQQRVRALFNEHVNDPILVRKFNLFDSSVTQKQWSTLYYYNELKNLNIKTSTIAPSGISTQSDISKQSNTLQLRSIDYRQPNIDLTLNYSPSPDMRGYCFELNLLLDGFLMNSMSVLDTLAHQIRVLYDFPLKGTKPEKKAEDIYISKIRDMLLESHPKSEVGRLLQQKLKPEPKPDWFLKFESLRNCTTHESLIGAEISPVWDQIERCYKAPKIILPDDPKEIPFTYIENREAISFCQTIFDNIESLLNEVYEAILTDIQNNNNILPIGKP